MPTEPPRRPSWPSAFLAGLLSALLIAGSVLLLQPRDEAVTLLIATPASGTITVAISGAVARPGLYQLPAGSRLTDLIERAGGPTAEAEPDLPSRALLLRDEMHVHLATRPPATALATPAATSPALATVRATPPPTEAATDPDPPGATPAATQPASADPTVATLAAARPTEADPTVRPAPSPTGPPTGDPATPRPPLNLNTATAAELERLPGIGPALAARILADRQRHGPYRRLEELDRVSGIGPALLLRLRPLVTV